MLFAIDIDGTIATSGNYFVRWIAKEAGIDTPDLEHLQYGFDFWELPQAQALNQERHAALREIAKVHHKDLDLLENVVPIPGAREALELFASEGERIIYTTCRPPEAEALTRSWLAHHNFPSSDQVRICDRYVTKYLHAHADAAAREPIVLIDDLVKQMVPAFVRLAKEYREIAISIIKRLAVVEIGRQEPRTFPYPVPFPVLALPSWRPEHLAQLR